MRLKDAIVGVGSFILGSIVTLNFISLGIIDKSIQINSVDGSDVSFKYSTEIKLFSAINYFLIVIVISAADNVSQRTAIRETWGLLSKDFPDVQYFFIVGSYGLSSEKISKIKYEQIRYNDMFLMSVPDSYKSLTKKVLHAFVWFSAEFNFKYILKCDDDSFVFIPKVVKELQNKLTVYKHLYWGYFDGRAHIKQLGKWKETNWFLCDRYLPYALGGGYVLSHSMVNYIKENEHMLGEAWLDWHYGSTFDSYDNVDLGGKCEPEVWRPPNPRLYRTLSLHDEAGHVTYGGMVVGIYLSEDVSVGVWLSPLNITRLHDVRFNTEYLSRGCSNSFIVTHKQSPENMRTLYSTLINKGVLCKSENITRKTYEYNWKVLPSKCCVPKL